MLLHIYFPTEDLWQTPYHKIQTSSKLDISLISQLCFALRPLALCFPFPQPPGFASVSLAVSHRVPGHHSLVPWDSTHHVFFLECPSLFFLSKSSQLFCKPQIKSLLGRTFIHHLGLNCSVFVTLTPILNY